MYLPNESKSKMYPMNFWLSTTFCGKHSALFINTIKMKMNVPMYSDE